MAKLFNRAKVATATTGTGTVTLGAAATGFATFAEAGVANGNVVSYCIEEGNDFELGRGTYASAGPTLTRDTVLLSKISGTAGTTKMTLAGAARVTITPLTQDIIELDVGGFVSSLEVGHASDTTLTRSAAGILAVEGTPLLKAGKETIWIPAGAMFRASGSSSPPLNTINMPTSNLPVSIQTLDFDATTEEYANFWVATPKSWNASTLTFKAVWSHPSTTTNFGVVWALYASAFSDDDAMDTNAGTAQNVTDTGGTTNDLYTSPESSALTVANTPAKEDLLHFRLNRVPGNASDTMAVDARLHGILLYFTTDAATDA